MGADVAIGAPDRATGERLASVDAPYAQSWVNRLIDLIEGLPGPAWVAYLVALVPATLLVSSTDWLSGAPIGEVRADRALWAFALVGSLWLIHHLDGVARRALGDFAVILRAEPATFARLEYELTVIPARPAVVILGVAALRTAQAFIFQPETEALVGQSPAGLAIRFPFETLMTSLLVILLYHTLRQLRLVGRIHAMPPRVNLFRPAPLYAFSRLTSQTAIGLVFLTVPFLAQLNLATTTLEVAFQLLVAGVILGIALLAFVTPLIGMHGRMDEEKGRLRSELGSRIEALLDDLHGSVDRRELAGADGQNKALASLMSERDLVSRLSTWPWQAGTAGAVASAILLPILLFLLTRFLDRVL